MSCPCGSSKTYESCCEPFILGTTLPDTAEQLMRSRYTAYVKGQIEYIKETLAPESRHDFDLVSTKKWAKQSKWLGLSIQSSTGGLDDKKGRVEFTATYNDGKENLEHHEVSEFRKDDHGRWYFVGGEAHTHREGEGHAHHPTKVETVVRAEPKVGRNDPCPCGSGKKYKKCHGT